MQHKPHDTCRSCRLYRSKCKKSARKGDGVCAAYEPIKKRPTEGGDRG